MRQCKELTGTIMPTFKQPGLPMIMGGDLNLYWNQLSPADERNVQKCVPAGYTRKGDADVQHVMWSGEMAFDRIEKINFTPWYDPASDHDGFLVSLRYYGSPTSPSPLPPNGIAPPPAVEWGPYIPDWSPVSTVHDSGRDPYWNRNGVMGAAVARGKAYYNINGEVRRLDLSTGSETVVADGFETGSNLRPKVDAIYGNTLIVTDVLGVYLVTQEGRKRKIDLDTAYTNISVSVWGNQLFIERWGAIYQVDLASADLSPQLMAEFNVHSEIAADADYLWGTYVDGEERGVLQRIDQVTGSTLTVSTSEEVRCGPMRSIGSYLYCAGMDSHGGYSRLLRISKRSGAVRTIAHVDGHISGIVSDGSSIYLADGELKKVAQSL